MFMMTIHWIVVLLAFLSVDAMNIPGRTQKSGTAGTSRHGSHV